MAKYYLKRILQSMVTLFIIVTIVFLLMRLMPESGYFGESYDKLNETQIEAILTDMGLRDPIPVQLKNFYFGLFKGDLGISNILRPKVPVAKIISEKVPYSVAFGLAAMGISLTCGLFLGTLMARSKGKFWDKFGTAFIVFVNAVPAAIYYLFLQLYVTGFFKMPMIFDKYNPVSWILPVVSMSLGGTASYAMWIRRYMVDEMNKDYVKLARAKGFDNKKVMLGHVFRNAFVPIVQYLPTSMLLTMVGSIYIESLYSIPGMGGLLVTVIQRQDNTVVQILVLIYSCVGIVGLMLGDILMGIVDPRIRQNRKEASR